MSSFRTQKHQLKKDPHRSHSSTQWLQRQLNDPFVQRAKRDGYRARSVYKLQEIDQKFQLIRKGRRVADLGAAPGSWSQYAARAGALIVAIDLLDIEPLPDVDFLKGDFLDPAVQDELRRRLNGPADVVLSDIAPDATGQRAVDRLRSEAVGEAVIAFAQEVIAAEGQVLIKLVKGAEDSVRRLAVQYFRTIRILRPEATRSGSSEIFMLAQKPISPNQS